MVVAAAASLLSQQLGMAAPARLPEELVRMCRTWATGSIIAAAVLALQASAMAPSSQAVTVDTRDPYFERRSELKVGAKGEDAIDVSATTACSRFHHAEVVWIERRFADAQFVQIPERGCIHCDPLVVRWYHEPTGKLHFEVKVYRTPCSGAPG